MRQPTTDNKRVWQFELLRCVACLSVVIIHSTSFFVPTPEKRSILGAFIRCASNPAVPLFVMMSGYFLLSNPKNVNCGYFYRKRLKRIGVPLVFWSFFYIFMDSALALSSTGNLTDFLELDNWLTRFYYGCSGCGNGGHLWYLYMTVGLYAITPFLLTIYNNYSTKVILFASSLLYLACLVQVTFVCYRSYPDTTFEPVLAFTFIPYFLLGKYWGDKASSKNVFSDMQYKFIRVTSVAVFCTVSLLEVWAGYNADSSRWCFSYPSLTTFIQAVSIYMFILSFRTAPRKTVIKILSWTSSLTFGIYLFHMFFLTFFTILFHRLGYETTVSLTVARALLAFLASAVATFIFKKIPYLRACV